MANESAGARSAGDARRLGYIDGLRAVAVLSVLVFHARVHLPNAPLGHVFMEGTHGVDLFFVLSGFCLAMPALERIARDGVAHFDITGYIGKRLLRIVPPYVAALALIAGGGWYLMGHGLPLPAGMPEHFDLTDVLSELLFLDRGLHHINSSFWSLAVEFRWYFLFPLALGLWARSRRTFLTVLVLVTIASEMTRATSTDVGVLPAFLLGVAAAGVQVARLPVARYAGIMLPLFVGIALVNEMRDHFPIQTNVGWHLAAFCFVVYAGRAAWLQSLLGARWLTAVGVASYSIYLVHEPIVSELDRLLEPRYGDTLATCAGIVAGLAAGFALWFGLERPLTNPAFVKAAVGRIRPALLRVLRLTDVPETIVLRGERRLAATPDDERLRETTVLPGATRRPIATQGLRRSS